MEVGGAQALLSEIVGPKRAVALNTASFAKTATVFCGDMLRSVCEVLRS